MCGGIDGVDGTARDGRPYGSELEWTHRRGPHLKVELKVKFLQEELKHNNIRGNYKFEDGNAPARFVIGVLKVKKLALPNLCRSIDGF